MRTDEKRKTLDAKEIAELDEETMPEVGREEMTAPTPGGDPEHHEPLTDETNNLTT